LVEHATGGVVTAMEARHSDHAEQRLYERFNLILDDALAQQLALKIDSGASALLGYQDNERELHAVEIEGRTIVAVWQPRDRKFITFLHPDEFRSLMRGLGSAQPKAAPPAGQLPSGELAAARHAEWVELMAARDLRTSKRWVALGRAVKLGAKPELHAGPVYPDPSKFYHINDTVPLHECLPK